MMSDIRKLVKEIDRGIRLDKNVPAYLDMFSDVYEEYAAVELTFSAYLLWQTCFEEIVLTEREEKQYTQVMGILKKMLKKAEDDLDGLVREISEIRDEIHKIMEGYTSCTDTLICYEMVLKRMRLNYPAGKMERKRVSRIREDEFLDRLMYFLLGEKDRSVVRDRVQTLIGRIPVHMTKSKFLERVAETIRLYQDGDRAALENFVYMIRSAGMLAAPEKMQEDEYGISDFIHRLEGVDFAGLEEEEYSELCQELGKVSEKIYRVTDYYYSLQKVVNGIYALCLLKKYGSKKTKLYSTCVDLLNDVTRGKCREEDLVVLEGKIEKRVEASGLLEAVLPEIQNSCADILERDGLAERFGDYVRVASLLSDSLFIDLEAVRDGEKADGEMIRRVTEELTRELSEKLSQLQKPLKRAVMAVILEQLPIEFSHAGEISTYIQTNLFGCQDDSERGVVMLELEEMMAEAEEWGDMI